MRFYGAAPQWENQPVSESKSIDFTGLDEPTDPARRAFSLSLGLFPVLPLLPGCGAGFEDDRGHSGPGGEHDRGGRGWAGRFVA